MYDPVWSRGFYRSRVGRIAARICLVLGTSVIAWGMFASPHAVWISLIWIPFFIGSKRRR